MLVKINKHGKGSGKSPINYLLGANRDRTGARVLQGNPFLTEKLIDATDYAQRYTSGTLSFEESPEQFTEEQKKDIMQRFESTIFSGLEPDQYNILWVEHIDKDRLELNFLIPNQELRSGKRLQPYYHAADKRRVNNFQDIINYEYKLTDPHDPTKKRLINPYGFEKKNAPTPFNSKPLHKIDNAKELRDEITKRLTELYESDRQTDNRKLWYLKSRKDVVEWLEENGLSIKRVTKNSISVHNGNDSIARNIRLKGDLFNERFRIERRLAEQKYDVGVTEITYQRALVDYDEGMKLKKQYHTERFDTLEPPTMPLNDVLIGNRVSLEQNDIKTSENANKQRQNRPSPF